MIDPPQLTVSHEPNEPLQEGRAYKFYCKSRANPGQFHNAR